MAINSAGSSRPSKEEMRRKTPSQRRRDERRKNEFLAKKSVEAKDIAEVNTINEAILIEPKDDIALEEPEAKDIIALAKKVK